MINDFIGPNRIIHEREAKVLSEKINRLLSVARQDKIPIVFINDSHESDCDWEFTRTLVHALKGSDGSKLVKEIEYHGEKIIEKSRYDAFYQTQLEDTLKDLKANQVILCGAQTHVCVLLTAMSSFYRGLKPIIVRDCTLSSTEDKHNFGLWYLENYAGDTADERDIEALFGNLKNWSENK
jgi:ureidoacrylate peracid hydrolase